jgi:hypothetical protein
MAKKEIDWKLYEKLDVYCLYDLILLSLNAHPEFSWKKLSPVLQEHWVNRSKVCLKAIENGELKPFSIHKGLGLEYPSRSYDMAIKDFVRFALNRYPKWELPDEFPYKAEIMANEIVECPFCHYETKLLKIQGEAIKKFWANFDPLKPETEPKSAVVIDWLKAEYGVSANVASVMASIIRPDGLKPGVKKQKKPVH